jgi:hypothetical protein
VQALKRPTNHFTQHSSPLKQSPNNFHQAKTSATIANTSTYQRQKEIDSLVKRLDKGQRSKLLELLLEEEVASWPAKSKEYDVTTKATQRLEWLKEHWGTQFVVEKQGKKQRPFRKCISPASLSCSRSSASVLQTAITR